MVYDAPRFFPCGNDSSRVWFTLNVIDPEHPDSESSNFVQLKAYVSKEEMDTSPYQKLTKGTVVTVDYVVRHDLVQKEDKTLILKPFLLVTSIQFHSKTPSLTL